MSRFGDLVVRNENLPARGKGRNRNHDIFEEKAKEIVMYLRKIISRENRDFYHTQYFEDLSKYHPRHVGTGLEWYPRDKQDFRGSRQINGASRKIL